MDDDRLVVPDVLDGTESPAEEPRLVECRLCPPEAPKIPFLPGKMSGHLSKHMRTKTKKWHKDEYLAKWPSAKGDFIEYGGSKADHAKNTERLRQINNPTPPPPKEDGTPQPLLSMRDQMMKELDLKEQEEFTTLYDNIFQQVDRDEAQAPIVASLVFAIIQSNRFRLKTLKKNYVFNEDTEKALKTFEDRVKSLSVLLSIDRKSKIANRVALKSTPSVLISGYLDEIERSSTESLETMRNEEQALLAVINARIEKYYLSVAPILKDDSDDDDAVRLDLDAVIRRANITL